MWLEADAEVILCDSLGVVLEIFAWDREAG